ncbi:MAG: sulfatase [Boseongicola sp. SB0670_bin_30]|nr:sulfatase [Boseongicola sp. SB0670_bin_30]
MKTILLMFDSLNRRVLECYGGSAFTPNFSRLSRRGVTFENHFVGSLPCMPARRDIQTGRLNFMHRSWGPLEPFDVCFPDIMRRNGIHSHLITDHYHYFEDGGLNYQNRFATWELERGQEWDPWKALVDVPDAKFRKEYHSLQYAPPGTAGGRARGMINREFISAEEEYSLPRCFARAIEFLDANRDADDWFLQLECFDPHEPFAAPDRFRSRYATGYNGPKLDWPIYKRVDESALEIEEIRANYLALVSMCDAYLGKLLDYMDANGMWGDTAVIMTTDHGFMLGEHDWWAKSRMPFYNEIANIPLIVCHPRFAEHAGQRRMSLTQNIDLMPTLLEWHGAEVPDTVCGCPLDPVLDRDETSRKVALYGQFGAALNVTDGRYTYFLYPEGPYDLDAQNIFEYTLMPTHQQEFFAATEFEGAEMVRGFDFMQGYPVIKIPARKVEARGQGAAVEDTVTVLYDLENDPGQELPIRDGATTSRLEAEVRRVMALHEAPVEAYVRLGLDPE